MTDNMTESQLRAASDQFYEALADVLAGESSAMLALWSVSEDAIYMGPGGGRIGGRDAIEQAWRDQAERKIGGQVTREDEQYVCSGELGIVTNWEVGSGHAGIPDEIRLRVTSTYRIESGIARMIGHHTDLF